MLFSLVYLRSLAYMLKKLPNSGDDSLNLQPSLYKGHIYVLNTLMHTIVLLKVLEYFIYFNFLFLSLQV